MINEVNVRTIRPKDGLVAIASIVIETELGGMYLGSIGLHTKKDKVGEYRLTYPNKKTAGSEIQIFYPISKELSREIENAIINEYENLIAQ